MALPDSVFELRVLGHDRQAIRVVGVARRVVPHGGA